MWAKCNYERGIVIACPIFQPRSGVLVSPRTAELGGGDVALDDGAVPPHQFEPVVQSVLVLPVLRERLL